MYVYIVKHMCIYSLLQGKDSFILIGNELLVVFQIHCHSDVPELYQWVHSEIWRLKSTVNKSCRSVCGEDRGVLWVSVLSFHRMHSRGQMYGVRLGGKRLHCPAIFLTLQVKWMYRVGSRQRLVLWSLSCLGHLCYHVFSPMIVLLKLKSGNVRTYQVPEMFGRTELNLAK